MFGQPLEMPLQGVWFHFEPIDGRWQSEITVIIYYQQRSINEHLCIDNIYVYYFASKY